MKLFNKPDDKQPKGSSIKRISSMETATIKSWFDNTLMGLGSAFDNYRYHDVPSADVTQHLDVLNELWNELQRREANS